MLLGSSLLPSLVCFPNGVRLVLGEVVRRAFKDSGLTEEQWNSISERFRDILLVAAYHDMREENPYLPG